MKVEVNVINTWRTSMSGAVSMLSVMMMTSTVSVTHLAEWIHARAAPSHWIGFFPSEENNYIIITADRARNGLTGHNRVPKILKVLDSFPSLSLHHPLLTFRSILFSVFFSEISFWFILFSYFLYPPTLRHEHAVHGALLAQYKWTAIIIIIIITEKLRLIAAVMVFLAVRLRPAVWSFLHHAHYFRSLLLVPGE